MSSEPKRSFGVPRYAALVVAAAGCSACTIAKMERDNDDATARITVKTEDLHREQAQQAQLQEAKAQLLSDLRSREVSAQELSEHLDKLLRLNEATSTSNAQMLRQKQQTARNLKDAADQLKLAQQPHADESPVASTKRLAETRQKIRDQLELMLAN